MRAWHSIRAQFVRLAIQGSGRDGEHLDGESRPAPKLP
jgi:hypothetical protein